MAAPDINQEEREEMAFRLFVEAAHLPIVSGSIRSERCPAPDILCEIRGRGLVAFELVQIVTPAFAKENANGQELREALASACAKHSEIAGKFGNALIYLGFLEQTAMHARLSVVPEVVEALHQYPEDPWGNITVPHKLRKVLAEISVYRGISDGPAFDIVDMTKRTNEIFDEVEKKFRKKYSPKHAIELLAYYMGQPSPTAFDWQSDFHDFVLKNLSRSPFKRVWIYDNWIKRVMYVYPAPE